MRYKDKQQAAAGQGQSEGGATGDVDGSGEGKSDRPHSQTVSTLASQGNYSVLESATESSTNEG